MLVLTGVRIGLIIWEKEQEVYIEWALRYR